YITPYSLSYGVYKFLGILLLILYLKINPRGAFDIGRHWLYMGVGNDLKTSHFGVYMGYFLYVYIEIGRYIFYEWFISVFVTAICFLSCYFKKKRKKINMLQIWDKMHMIYLREIRKKI
ncbi:hypothetical protein ACJX0J_024459, partial [Zea mays]